MLFRSDRIVSLSFEPFLERLRNLFFVFDNEDALPRAIVGRSNGRPVAWRSMGIDHWPEALHRHPSFGRTMERRRKRHAPASRPGLPVMIR